MELKNPNTEVVSRLMKVSWLTRWAVTCYLPKSEMYKYGVISPMSTAIEMQGIKELIRIREGSADVHKIERLRKKTETGWIDSVCLKITFQTSNLPAAVTIGHSYYRVRPFVEQPIQCFRCHRLGHIAIGCRAKVRCLLCGGGHPKEQCQAQAFECANCKGRHKAYSRECSLIQMACKIEKVKAYKNETHAEARKQVHAQSSRKQQDGGSITMKSHIVQAEVHHGLNSQAEIDGQSRSYSEMLKTIDEAEKTVHKQAKTYAGCATQTDISINKDSGNSALMTQDGNLSDIFLGQLKLCLLELLLSEFIN